MVPAIGSWFSKRNNKGAFMVSELVSVLIPAYNADKWIKQTIESAIHQTWDNKEGSA